MGTGNAKKCSGKDNGQFSGKKGKTEIINRFYLDRKCTNLILKSSTTNENAIVMFISTVTLASDSDVALNKGTADQGL